MNRIVVHCASLCLVVCIGAFYASTGCKKSTTSPVSPAGGTTIGPAGGTVASSDGKLSLVIPAGALSSDVAIAIATATDTSCPLGVGALYQLTPEGTTFATPAHFVAQYSDNDIAGSSAMALGVAFQGADGKWHRNQAGHIDTNAHTITADISHFSRWRVYQGFSLHLDHTAVTTGGSAAANPSVQFTAPPIGVDDSADILLDYNVSARRSITKVQWYANGVEGGDATDGTIVSIGAIKTGGYYVSPNQIPDQNPVHLRATLSVEASGGEVLRIPLYADVMIVGKQWKFTKEEWAGWMCDPASNAPLVATFEIHSKGEATFSLDDNMNVTNVQTNDGVADVTVKPTTCLEYYEVSNFNTGGGVAWKKFSPAIAVDYTSFNIDWSVLDLDQPSITVQINLNGQKTVVVDQRVADGGHSGGLTPFPMRKAPTEKSFSNEDSQRNYQRWTYRFEVVQ